MQVKMSVSVTVNGAQPAPVADLVSCCCGDMVGTADDLSECLACGGFMCAGARCDCPCPVYED
ncbi:MAG: hypothetical protein ABSA85_09995 [Terracidiphilus sp.]|jgi:hypothetical protein